MEYHSAGRDGNVAVGKRIIDANLYMTLATADGEGRPWASPVWYAHEKYLSTSRPPCKSSKARLFRASGSALFILGPSDQRLPVDLRGA